MCVCVHTRERMYVQHDRSVLSLTNAEINHSKPPFKHRLRAQSISAVAAKPGLSRLIAQCQG